MRILQLIQRCQLRGAEVFACQLAEELIKKNHTVDVAYVFDTDNALPFELNFIPIHGNTQRRFCDFAAYKRLNELVRKGQYDIVQANAGDTLKYAILSKRLYGWKNPVVFRNANKMSDFLKGKLHIRLNQWFLSQCSYIISVSENCRQDIIQVFSPASSKSETIAIGTKTFNDVLPLEIKKDRPVLINIASLVPEKNHFFLLDVFETFRRKNNGTLLILGDGKLRESIETRIKSLDLTDNVILMGSRRDAISILKSADVLVLPSKIEGLPGVILEALSCGIPVVTSDVGGIPEVIEDGKTGFILHQWVVDRYVKKIEEALYNDALKAKIIVHGKELVSMKFLMPHIAAQFLIAYNSIAKVKNNA